MKKFSKIMAVILTLAMMFSFAGIAAATETDPTNGGGSDDPAVSDTPASDTLTDGSIKITPPDGLDASATNTYVIYKVFDATNNGEAISYTLDSRNGALSDAMKTAGFAVDAAGNVTGPASLDADAIAAIAAYATHQVATVTATGTAAVTATGLGAGYYYITTTTGTVVTIDSTNPSADVRDKNTVPSVDKKLPVQAVLMKTVKRRWPRSARL